MFVFRFRHTGVHLFPLLRKQNFCSSSDKKNPDSCSKNTPNCEAINSRRNGNCCELWTSRRTLYTHCSGRPIPTEICILYNMRCQTCAASVPVSYERGASPRSHNRRERRKSNYSSVTQYKALLCLWDHCVTLFSSRQFQVTSFTLC